MAQKGPAKRTERACPACYRPMPPTRAYCEACEASGGADFHRRQLALRMERPSGGYDRMSPEERERRNARHRRVGDQDDPRAHGARVLVGAQAHVQHPARDQAMQLCERPGETVAIHTYRSPERVKAAIWYLRHRCELPDGFRFWRQGSTLMGVYEPS